MKAQTNIIYLLITIAIAVILASGTYLSSHLLKSKLNKDLAEEGAEEILQRVQSSILKMRSFYEKNITNASLKIAIPERIGEQKYIIAGFKNKLELKTLGNPSIVKIAEIYYWNISIQGSVGSEKESITIEFLNDSALLIH